MMVLYKSGGALGFGEVCERDEARVCKVLELHHPSSWERGCSCTTVDAHACVCAVLGVYTVPGPRLVHTSSVERLNKLYTAGMWLQVLG